MKQRWILVVALLAALCASSSLLAQNNACDLPGESPDLIVADIYVKYRFGELDGITAFAVGTEACNVGTCWANWINNIPDHPVIGQNMFRLKAGRFEQIGQSWIKHAFATIDGDLCEPPICIPADGQHLGVSCSDPYNAGQNGSHLFLGPKFEVNPETGVHPHPYTAQGQAGNVIYKRLQVHNVDLDPVLNPGALYFVEAQYVAADDSAGGNQFNNASHRRIDVTLHAGEYDINLAGLTFVGQPGVRAWKAADPNVLVKDIDKEYVGASNTTDLGGGMWNYELALQNVSSHDSARSVRIPIPHGVQLANVGFHDVDYHSGEPFDGSDWAVEIDTSSSPHAIVWSAESYAENPDANALRWGTLYNFRFDADFPPTQGVAAIEQFRPGSTGRLWSVLAPDRCGDAFCDNDENDVSCATDCAFLGDAGEVPDGSATPGTQLTVEPLAFGEILLSWDDSCLAGDTDYEVYEGLIGDFTSHRWLVCSTTGATSVPITPSPGNRYYLIVPNNGFREGSYGIDSTGTPRPQGAPACMSQSVAPCF